MSLIDSMMDECVLINKIKEPDGAGGFIPEYIETAHFSASVLADTTMQARIADKDGMKSTYTVTTRQNVGLEFHDIFKVLKTGQTYRITSDPKEKHSPNASTLNIQQSTAERWELP